MKHPILIFLFATIFVSCKKKQEEYAQAYQKETNHLSQKWQVQEAHTNATGKEVDNMDDVTYDWEKWDVEFFNNNAYIINEYAPDSSSLIRESGTWSFNIEGPISLKGSEDLIDFTSGAIIDEGETHREWVRVKNENNQLWIWTEDSYYVNTGVFLKMIPL